MPEFGRLPIDRTDLCVSCWLLSSKRQIAGKRTEVWQKLIWESLMRARPKSAILMVPLRVTRALLRRKFATRGGPEAYLSDLMSR